MYVNWISYQYWLFFSNKYRIKIDIGTPLHIDTHRHTHALHMHSLESWRAQLTAVLCPIEFPLRAIVDTNIVT